MGGLCSRRATSENTTGRSIPHVNGHFNYGAGTVYQSHRLPSQANNDSVQSPLGESTENQPSEPVFSFPELNAASHGVDMDAINDGIPRLSRVLSNKTRPTRSKQVAMAKVSEVSSLLGRAGTVGLGKAVDVLDTLGSSMTNLNLSGGFASSMATKGNQISILAFEVANTIVKGANLMYSLSNENIKHLKEVVLPSEGVQLLISKDMDELFRIAAADKRDELKIFSCEVVRFGNSCKDPQWHNLDRYFEKLESELTPHKQLKEEAETLMLHLMTLVQYSAELYHELHALDRIEQDCRRKAQEEDTSNATQKGDSLAILRAELKSQKKHVKSLKKKSLWSKILEEVMEKLVDIVHFLHLEIHAAFGNTDGDRPIKNNHQRLGSAGLALHYANIITQIDTLVTRSGSVPPNTRDALYQGLPPSIKSALRFKLQSFQLKEELTVQQIKAEMEKTLQWLVPMATNTTKAHHGFGWVGEWANTGKPAGQTDLLRIETLYHADLLVFLSHKDKSLVYLNIHRISFQESLGKPNSQSEDEKKIPVFTVLKNGAILKNIFLLDNPPATPVAITANQEFEEILVVGRHPDCNIVLEHPSISRFHLRIHSNPSSHSLSVIDLSSVHGSWISGNKIEPGVRVELKEGDKMKLGGSRREYMLHWIPISRAYDLENPFVAPLGEAEPFKEMDEKEHQDENGFALQNEGDDLMQDQDSSFSCSSLLPYIKCPTPSAPPMPEEMKSSFPYGDEEVNINPLEKIHGESEISLLQPAYEPDQENSSPRALLVSGGIRTENADSTPVRSQQRCLNIWSRRGKCSSVQIQTGRDRAFIEKVDIDTEVHTLDPEKVAMESVFNDPFSRGNKDEEDAFTPDKENHVPSSLLLGSEKNSCLTDGQTTKPMLSCCMDENGEENFTLDKVDFYANTHSPRSMKKMSCSEQIKNPKSFRSSPMKETFDSILTQAEGLEYYTENVESSTILSNMSKNSEQIFTPDKENMTPDSYSMRSIKKGNIEEVKQRKPFAKENLNDKVLEEKISASLASRNKARMEVTMLKNRTDRVPFQPLLVANSLNKTKSESPERKVKLNAKPVKCQEIIEACPFANNNAREEKRRWTMVVDITSLLTKESRKALQLLQGLKGTCLIIPRIVLRELDYMKRRASFFRRATEVFAALDWIDDCMVNAKSWVHVQSCVEETRPVAPTPPATAPPYFFNEENGIFPVGSVLSSPHCGLAEIVSPTAEDHILEYALLFKRTNRDGQLVLLSNDLTMKIKAMAEGIICETAEDFQESLVNPFSERFLWKDSSPRGSTWSCVDDFVLGPLRKTSKSGQAAKGLKLILLHNSHYRQICSGSTVS